MIVWTRLAAGQDLELLTQIDPSYLGQLVKPHACPAGCEQVAVYAQRIINGEDPRGEDAKCELIRDVKTLTDSLNNAELARAALDPQNLVIFAARSLSSGMIGGTPMNAREKIEILKILFDKAIPSAKSVERAEVAEKLDRRSRSLKDMTKKEIDSLSINELRDLVQKAKEESEVAPEGDRPLT